MTKSTILENNGAMALNIKNPAVEQLVSDIASLTGETKTEAVRKALEERKERLSLRVAQEDREGDLMRFLEREVWPLVPPDQLGRRLSSQEEDEILGYGPDGV
ncbi:MAG: type II toxin-antitoxin system VapB family antitoxin [Acidobacteriota bacterium]